MKSMLFLFIVVALCSCEPTNKAPGASGFDPAKIKQTSPTLDVTDYVTCAIRDKELWCVGRNMFQSLMYAKPTQIQEVENAVQVSLSKTQACAVDGNGHVYCWGDSRANKNPTRVPDLNDARQVSAARASACAVLNSNEVKCWGQGKSGQLGDKTNADSKTPVSVVGLKGVAEVRSRGDMHCARTIAGEVWCWGKFSRFKKDQIPVPRKLDLSDIRALYSGPGLLCSLDGKGVAKCWGDGSTGILGVKDENDRWVSEVKEPTVVPAVSGAISLAPNESLFCAVLSDGTAGCLGSNSHGQRGEGKKPVKTLSDWVGELQPVKGLKDPGFIASSGYHACAEVGDLLSCWGSNHAGQLGLVMPDINKYAHPTEGAPYKELPTNVVLK